MIPACSDSCYDTCYVLLSCLLCIPVIDSCYTCYASYDFRYDSCLSSRYDSCYGLLIIIVMYSCPDFHMICNSDSIRLDISVA